MSRPIQFRVGSVNKVGFSGGSSMANFLKCTETSPSVVSEPFDFVGSVNAGNWKLFAVKLKSMLTQEPNLPNVYCGIDGGELVVGKDQMRLIMQPTTPLNQQLFQGQERVVTVPMKLKLIPNIPCSAPRVEWEQGCLVKLVRLVGHENVKLSLDLIAHQGRVPLEDKRSQSYCRLVWNEADLSWEEETEVTFCKEEMQNFASESVRFNLMIGYVDMELNDVAVNRVLRRIYSRCGDSWRSQQRLLEEGQFSDLVIISNHPKNQNALTPIKCHRMQLAGASQVFANMIQESSSWEEAKTGIIKLPESEDAIKAMLHFIYYGGTDRIYGNAVNPEVVLELLQAGHKYNIENLVDVAAFVFHARSQERDTFNATLALELYCFARNLEGQVWADLKQQAYDYFEMYGCQNDDLMECEAYQKLREIAEKLGPVFVSVLQNIGYVEEDEKEEMVPHDLVNVSRDEAAFMYDLLSCGMDYRIPRSLDVAVGLILLAEYCGQKLPDIAENMTGYFRNSKYYEVNYLVDLFCLVREKNGGKYWKELKMGSVQKLKKILIKQPELIQASVKYTEMFSNNVEAAKEFTRLSNQECKCVKKRRLD